MFLLLTGKQGGLGFSLPGASGDYGAKRDAEQILRSYYDATNHGIKCVDAGAPSGDHGTKMSSAQVWKKTCDTTLWGLRVVQANTEIEPYGSEHFDEDQIIRDCYDPTANAIRVNWTLPNNVTGLHLDAAQVFQVIYHRQTHTLRVTEPVAGSGTYGAIIDGRQVVTGCFDTATGKLRIVG